MYASKKKDSILKTKSWARLGKEEVMEQLRISPSTYYDWIKRGYLKPCSKLGEGRFLVQHINQFVTRMRNRERTDFGDEKKEGDIRASNQLTADH